VQSPGEPVLRLLKKKPQDAKVARRNRVTLKPSGFRL